MWCKIINLNIFQKLWRDILDAYPDFRWLLAQWILIFRPRTTGKNVGARTQQSQKWTVLNTKIVYWSSLALCLLFWITFSYCYITNVYPASNHTDYDLLEWCFLIGIFVQTSLKHMFHQHNSVSITMNVKNEHHYHNFLVSTLPKFPLVYCNIIYNVKCPDYNSSYK